MLGAALAPPEPSTERRVGNYELLDVVARGGMGVVYRARDLRLQRIVALKRLVGGPLADDGEMERLRAEAARAAALDHPGIVPVYEVGEHEGAPYVAMRLIEGGTLTDRIGHTDARQAATLVAAVAHAVHHAHQRGVLHRDLKPDNVLVDAQGQPVVADFGLARRLGQRGSSTTGAAGTPGFMAPEVFDQRPDALTVAVDVYGLGALLYALLSGRAPIEGDTLVHHLRLLREQRPAALVDVDRDLAAICLKCLEKSPTHRYRSADGLAHDLERWLRGDEVIARPLGPIDRVLRLAGSHPLAFAGASIGVLIVVAVAIVAVHVARTQEVELRERAYQANAFAAQALAGSVLHELDKLALAVRAAADRVEAGATLESVRADPALALADSVARLDGLDAIKVARAPPGARPQEGRAFAWRDYVHGLRELPARAVHFSRAYRSTVDDTIRVSLSTTLASSGGAAADVLEVALHVDHRLGDLDLSKAQTWALLARWDRQSPEGALPDDWAIVVHEALDPHAAPLLLRLSPLGDAPTRLECHRDPVPGFEGCWLAAAALVPATPYAVIVQTRDLEVLAPKERLVSRLLATVAIAALVGGAATLLLAALARARRRRRARPRAAG
ncbi:MAG: serine/threonine protein kinase [Deltaproteobacteria bacterium]|nr:serine/threonine protein kinase [Deltaproteobacteria bacterium]